MVDLALSTAVSDAQGPWKCTVDQSEPPAEHGAESVRCEVHVEMPRVDRCGRSRHRPQTAQRSRFTVADDDQTICRLRDRTECDGLRRAAGLTAEFREVAGEVSRQSSGLIGKPSHPHHEMIGSG